MGRQRRGSGRRVAAGLVAVAPPQLPRRRRPRSTSSSRKPARTRSASSRKSAPVSPASASPKPRRSSRARRSLSRKASPRKKPRRSRRRSKPPAPRSRSSKLGLDSGISGILDGALYRVILSGAPVRRCRTGTQSKDPVPQRAVAFACFRERFQSSLRSHIRPTFRSRRTYHSGSFDCASVVDGRSAQDDNVKGAPPNSEIQNSRIPGFPDSRNIFTPPPD